MGDRKILTQRKLKELVSDLKNRKRVIVTTNGVFDILHAGHVSYLNKARKLGDTLIILINSDKSVRRIKGKGRPINNQHDRALLLSALECVDYVSIFNEDDPCKILAIIKPNYHVKARDYSMNQIIEKESIEKNKGKIILLPYKKGYSTTSLIKKINRING